MIKMHLYILVLFTVIVGSILRLYALGSVPHGFTHDEIGYIYNAYSFSETGKNVYGANPSFFTYHVLNGFPFMPVPTYLLAAFFRFVPLTFYSARLFQAILGIVSIILIFFLSRFLFKNSLIALFTSISLTFSPWHIFFSRTAYDVPIAAFFYLLFIVFFLAEKKRGKISFLSVLSLGFALFSYRGMSPLAIGLIIVIVFFAWFSKPKNKKFLFSTLLSTSIVFLVFIGIGITQKNRGFFSEAIYNNNTLSISSELAMRETQAPHNLKRIFLNKPYLFLRSLISNYIEGYSLGNLFLYGEASQTYTMWMRGKLYLLDIVLLIIGIYFLVREKKFTKETFFVFGLLGVSGLPGMVAGQPYATRNFFMVYPLAIVSGIGLYYVFMRYRKYIYLLIFIGILYMFQITDYLFDYYGRYAYQREES